MLLASLSLEGGALSSHKNLPTYRRQVEISDTCVYENEHRLTPLIRFDLLRLMSRVRPLLEDHAVRTNYHHSREDHRHSFLNISTVAGRT